MPHVYNLFHIKVNELSNNASINFGNSIHKANIVNEKNYGGNKVVGEANSTVQHERLFVKDPDLKDQSY